MARVPCRFYHAVTRRNKEVKLATVGEQPSQLLIEWNWRDFFLRSPFHSGYFIILVVMFVGVVLLDLYILVYYWYRLSTVEAAVFYLYSLAGTVVPMMRLLHAHGRIHEMYLSGRITEAGPESPLSVALETASAALQTGVFNTLTAVLFALLVVLHFGVHGR